MALNTDFKVKDSLYVGNSAYFVTQTDTPVILSAGSSLFDIFLQEGEVATNCILRAGDDGGITSFSYDGTSAQTISISSTYLTNWNGTYDWCTANSGTVLSAATWVADNGANAVAAYDWCTANSGTVLSAATWVATNGGSVIDTVATGSSQGYVAVTDIDNNTTQVLVNNLASTCSPGWAGVCAGNIQVGITGDNEIDTSTGNLTIDSGGGNTIIDDNLCVTTGFLNVVNGQILSGGNDLFTIFSEGDITCVDTGAGLVGGGASGCVVVCANGSLLSSATWVADNGANVYDTVASTLQGSFTATDIGNNLDAVDLGLTPADSPIFAGLSAVTLSGDGTCITNVTATACFPTTACTSIAGTDKIFINDDAGCATSGNKHITYGCFLADLSSGTGICVEGGDGLGIVGAAGLSTNNLTKWNGSGFVDSIASEATVGGGTTLTIGGSAVIQGDLTVEGNLTCLDTLVQLTSAICIINAGTGPAVYAEQTGANQPIAKFVDTEGGSIVFGDTGNVGIGIIGDVPGEKLTVGGGLSASGDITTRGNIVLSDTCTVDGRDVSADGLKLDSVYTQFNSLSGGVLNHLAECSQGIVTTYNLSGGTCDVGFGLEPTDSPTFAGVTGGNIQVGITGDNEIDTSSGNLTIDSDGGTTIIDDALRTTGGAVFVSTLSAAGATTIEDNLTIGAQSGTIGSSTIQMTASALNGVAGAYSKQQSFMTYVDSTPTSVSTFTKTVNSRDIKQMKYLITLKKGVNITSFEVNAVYNGTAPCGTTYGIVDAQAASQLDTISIVGSGSDIELYIGAASDATDAIIHGTALY